MKNLNTLLQDSSVLELNSVEMEEIVGGGWFSNLLHKLADAIEAIADFLDSL
jgi:hypothetical protein